MSKETVDNPDFTWREVYEDLFSEILTKTYNDPPNPNGGHPRLYETPVDFAKRAIEYFVRQHQFNKPITFEGLRLHMKFWSPKSFYDYENNTKQYAEDFAKCVQIVKLIIYHFNTEKLYSTSQHAGAKFSLQCNYGWVPVERQIVEDHTFKVKIGEKLEEAREKESKDREK